MSTINVENKFKILKEFNIDDKVFYIVEPTLNIVRDSKYNFSKTFTDSLKSGFYTRKKLEMILKQDHVDIIQNHIDKRSELLQEMVKIQGEIETCQDAIQLRYLAEILRINREAIFQEDLSMKSMFDSTADSLADEERINFLTFSLTKTSDFKPIWISYDDFLNDNDYVFVERCRYEVLCWEYKIDPNWQKTLPETEALKRADSMIEDLVAEHEANEIREALAASKERVNKNKAKVKAKKIKKPKATKR